MKITKIKADYIEPKDTGICGVFTIILDDLICIHKINVINGKKGLFIAFPNLHKKNCEDTKKYFDIVHPTNQSFRKYIEDSILYEYSNAIKEK